jgi:hypothetical protein
MNFESGIGFRALANFYVTNLPTAELHPLHLSRRIPRWLHGPTSVPIVDCLAHSNALNPDLIRMCLATASCRGSRPLQIGSDAIKHHAWGCETQSRRHAKMLGLDVVTSKSHQRHPQLPVSSAAFGPPDRLSGMKPEFGSIRYRQHELF